MKRALLPLLMISPLVMAEPQVEAPMPPAMVSIPAPELEKRSLEEELNRAPGTTLQQRRKGYSLGTHSGNAYLEPQQDNDLHKDMLTPQWELFNWKGSSGNR